MPHIPGSSLWWAGAGTWGGTSTPPPEPPPPAPPPAPVAPRVQTIGGAENIIKLQKFPSGAGRSEEFIFPVNPETIDVTHHRDSYDVALLGGRTISRDGSRLPREVTFASFFPDPKQLRSEPTAAPSWLNVPVAKLAPPWTTVIQLQAWQNQERRKDGKAPLHIVIADTYIDWWVMITAFDVSTHPREVGDVYYTITFKEIIPFPGMGVTKPRTLNSPRTPAATVAAGVKAAAGAVTAGATTALAPARVDPKPAPTSYITHTGDHLQEVSHSQYGLTTPALVDLLWKANKVIVGSSPNNMIQAGVKLVVPPKP